MPHLTAFTDLPYSDHHPRCRLDLVRPAEGKPAPLVLMIHGGGWAAGERTQFLPHCVRLAEAGFAAATLGYRLVPDAVWPEIGLDVARGAAFLKAREKEFGIDASRAVTFGSSAGGHLALVLQALGPGWVKAGKVGAQPQIIGVVAQCPAIKLPVIKGPAATQAQLAGNHQPEEYSPHAFDLKLFANVLVIHGDADELIPLDDSKEFVRRLSEHGVAACLEVLPGVQHGFGYQLHNEPARKGLELGIEHLRKCLT